MLLVRGETPPPAGLSRRRKTIGITLIAALLTAGAFVAGTAVPAAPADPIELRAGAPVGVEHSPSGAAAAADEYVATEQQAVERDPTRFASLVSQDYDASIRRSALAAAAGDRSRDPRGTGLWLAGGESFTAVAAHRLDWYRGDSAQVTTWAVQVFWGPGQPPCQVWGLGATTLAWSGGRWRVTSMSTLPSAAPTPAAAPQASAADSSAARFSTELESFSLVHYGSPA